MKKIQSNMFVFGTDSTGGKTPCNIEELSTEERITYLTSKSKDYLIHLVQLLCEVINEYNKDEVTN